jgi:hypothetical protein
LIHDAPFLTRPVPAKFFDGAEIGFQHCSALYAGLLEAQYYTDTRSFWRAPGFEDPQEDLKKSYADDGFCYGVPYFLN